MKYLRRVKLDEAYKIAPNWPKEPFVMDGRWSDIPHTLMRTIMAMPDNCVAVSLRFSGFTAHWQCERAARIKNIRIIWMRPTKINYN